MGPVDRARATRAARPAPGRDEWSIDLDLGGRAMPCVVRRSSRARYLRLTVDRRRGPVVTVPARAAHSHAAAERLARSFVADRQEWLRRHVEHREMRLRELAALGGLRDGATIQYRGEPHRLRLVAAPGRSRSTVARYGADECDEIVVEISPRDRRPIETVLRLWLRERARHAIAAEIARHAPEMAASPRGVTLRDQRTRWGSCSRQGRLSFSWRLVLAPPAALETVVVHELAHLRVFGHNAAFWALVTARVPDHRRWRKWLGDHSFELHSALEDLADVVPLTAI